MFGVVNNDVRKREMRKHETSLNKRLQRRKKDAIYENKRANQTCHKIGEHKRRVRRRDEERRLPSTTIRRNYVFATCKSRDKGGQYA